MTAKHKPAHVTAPRNRHYPARHRKPNRRREVTTYYPTVAEIQTAAYLASMRAPLGIF